MNFENLEKNNENQKRIAMIERLKTGFEQKAGLVLVLLGEKPALSLAIFVDTPEEAQIEEEKINNIGLKSRKTSQQEKNGKYIIKFLIARNDNNLNELAEADPSVDHAKFGGLMGYPSTAVEAFSEGKLMDIDEERELLGKYPEIVFHNFRLSQDGQEEEIETLKRWNSIIKKAAPNIYPRIG
jgi:hypothetical protein